MHINIGDRVRVAFPRDARNRLTCSRHPLAVANVEGELGQVVRIRDGVEHGIGVMFLKLWSQGTPWTDSFKADELELIPEPV